MVSYTFLQLKNAAAHAIGGQPDSRISLGIIVNRAVNHLVNYAQWRWRNKLATLDFEEDEGDIPLPADFGEIIQLKGFGAKYTSFRPVSPETLLNLRVHGVPDNLSIGYNIGIGEQSSDFDNAPGYVLRIAPVPSDDLEDALYILYRNVMPSFTTDDDSDDDDEKIAAVPGTQQDTLYQLCRAFAVSMEESPGNAEWDLANSFLKRDLAADSRVEEPVVADAMRNCHVDDYQTEGNFFRPHMEIRMPGDP